MTDPPVSRTYRHHATPLGHIPEQPRTSHAPRQPGKTAAEMRADQEAWRDSQPASRPASTATGNTSGRSRRDATGLERTGRTTIPTLWGAAPSGRSRCAAGREARRRRDRGCAAAEVG